MNNQNINYHDLLIGIDSKVKTIDNTEVRAINLDNAATTPPLKKTIEGIVEFSEYYGSIGRGAGQKAEITTRFYNQARNIVKNFFNIKNNDKYSVIFVGNTTDGINKLSRILIKNKKDVVLLSRMEHHSNDLPWRKRCKVDYIEVDKMGRLKIKELEEKLIKYKGNIKYVSITGASNVTGYVNDLKKIARIVHKYKAKLIIDGAQLVPHVKVDMFPNKEEQIDFLVFSAHKMYAPFGAGAIVGLKDFFDKGSPANEGGGTVNLVLDKSVEYLLSPEKDEAGTPNFFGVVAMIKAMEELDRIGFDMIHKNEIILKEQLNNGLKSIPNITIYGDSEKIDDSLGIIVFNINSMYHESVAQILATNYGISVRHGWFCAHPYCRRLMHINEKVASAFIHDSNFKMPGMIRVSLGMYNDKEDIDYFLNAIEDIAKC